MLYIIFVMRILQLGKFYPIHGGVEKVMYDLLIGLTQRGIHCDMLCANFDVREKGFIKSINDIGSLICSSSIMKVSSTMISPSMVLKLRKMCNDYDIIHVHHPDPMAALSLWFSGYKGKVILHWHSDIIKQKNLLKFYLPLQTWLINRADVIFGTTPVYLLESPYLRSVQNKCEVLPIGISPILPDEKKVLEIKERYNGKKIVFSLGRLVSYKGFKYLVDAAKYLSDDYIILIGGDGNLKKELQEQIIKSRLSEKVKLLGRVSDDDLPNYYGACDVYCLSSIHKTEAFAIVQIEAMSCGKPVVATKIPGSGVSWVNADGESGLNVEPENSKALAEAIYKILGDTEQYQKYSTGARERFAQLFKKENMIDSVLNYYQKELSCK